MTKPTLIIMAKAPRIGAGKQRLAATIGKTEAWRINRALHRITLLAACDARWRVLLCVSPDGAAQLNLPGVWPDSVARGAQGGGDLGARLARAMAGRRNVALIGTDCPLLTRAHIARAFAALKRAPFAMGPAADGGFWLLAARSGSHAAKAMANVRWSSAHAGADVRANLKARVEMLPELFDVDEARDLERWRRHGSPMAAAASPSSGR